MNKEIILTIIIWITMPIILSLLKVVRLSFEHFLFYTIITGVIGLLLKIFKKRKS